MKKGFTLVETLVGVFLTTLVFLGVFAVFQLGLKIVGQSKARTDATALAQERIEEMRSLPYESVGTQGGFPAGQILSTESLKRNNISFSVETLIDYVADTSDGLSSPQDTCPNDYKKASVKVSWASFFGGELKLNTLISPKSLAEECAEPGGLLKVSVFDSQGRLVSFPEITVTNVKTNLIKTNLPDNGIAYFVLPPDNDAYRIVVEKPGFSQDRTFAAQENYQGKVISTPINPQATVLKGQLTETSFAIDHLADLIVRSFSEGDTVGFIDSFWDETKIVEKNNVVVSNGQVSLARAGQDYASEGYLISQTVSPTVSSWNQLTYSENTPPQTKICYQVLYLDGTTWVLVPDQDLPGNSSGLSPSPIDLQRLDPDDYPAVRFRATLSSSGSHQDTPLLFDWEATWLTTQPSALASVPFGLQGEKIVGYDSQHQPIYKYSGQLATNGSGLLNQAMEWDVYSFSVDKSQALLDLVRTDPSQPVSLIPDQAETVDLFLKAENTLLVIVQSAPGWVIFSANVRLYNQDLGYDKSLLANEGGQAFFIPLKAATYNLEVSAPGYANFAGTVSVSGTTTQVVTLNPL